MTPQKKHGDIYILSLVSVLWRSGLLCLRVTLTLPQELQMHFLHPNLQCSEWIVIFKRPSPVSHILLPSSQSWVVSWPCIPLPWYHRVCSGSWFRGAIWPSSLRGVWVGWCWEHPEDNEPWGCQPGVEAFSLGGVWPQGAVTCLPLWRSLGEGWKPSRTHWPVSWCAGCLI